MADTDSTTTVWRLEHQDKIIELAGPGEFRGLTTAENDAVETFARSIWNSSMAKPPTETLRIVYRLARLAAEGQATANQAALDELCAECNLDVVADPETRTPAPNPTDRALRLARRELALRGLDPPKPPGDQSVRELAAAYTVRRNDLAGRFLRAHLQTIGLAVADGWATVGVARAFQLTDLYLDAAISGPEG